MSPHASPLLALARDMHQLPATPAPPPTLAPRERFLRSCLRLEAAGQEEGATARRIYCRSSLADEIALPDADAAGRIIRVLNDLARPQGPRAQAAAREAITAICDLLAPPLNEVC